MTGFWVCPLCSINANINGVCVCTYAFLLAQLGSVFTRFALCIHFQYLEIDGIPKQANIDLGGRN